VRDIHNEVDKCQMPNAKFQMQVLLVAIYAYDCKRNIMYLYVYAHAHAYACVKRSIVSSPRKRRTSWQM
jgi:hypothetical protein